MNILRASRWLLVVLLFPLGAPAQAALVPPAGFATPVRADAKDREAEECKPLPKPYTGKLEFPSKYEGSDKARDDFNPKAAAKYEAMIKDIREMERQVSAQVARYLRSGHEETLHCVLDALAAWADADALGAQTRDHTGKSVRKWALASLASAWVRLKFSPSEPLAQVPDQAERIEAWFGELGERVVKDWKNQPLEKINNHEYWAAWAVMATGVALDRRDFFDWALGQYRIAAKQVDADGYLPNELKRETRALAYHNYALGPLAMIAAFAKANGVDLRDSQPAMQRLAGRVLQGVDDPAIFQQRTGEKQELGELQESSKFAWMEAHCWTFGCGEAEKRRMNKLRPLKTYRLGGNLTELFGPAAKKTARAAPLPAPLPAPPPAVPVRQGRRPG